MRNGTCDSHALFSKKKTDTFIHPENTRLKYMHT